MRLFNQRPRRTVLAQGTQPERLRSRAVAPCKEDPCQRPSPSLEINTPLDSVAISTSPSSNYSSPPRQKRLHRRSLSFESTLSRFSVSLPTLSLACSQPQPRSRSCSPKPAPATTGAHLRVSRQNAVSQERTNDTLSLASIDHHHLPRTANGQYPDNKHNTGNADEDQKKDDVPSKVSDETDPDCSHQGNKNKTNMSRALVLDRNRGQSRPDFDTMSVQDSIADLSKLSTSERKPSETLPVPDGRRRSQRVINRKRLAQDHSAFASRPNKKLLTTRALKEIKAAENCLLKDDWRNDHDPLARSELSMPKRVHPLQPTLNSSETHKMAQDNNSDNSDNSDSALNQGGLKTNIPISEKNSTLTFSTRLPRLDSNAFDTSARNLTEDMLIQSTATDEMTDIRMVLTTDTVPPRQLTLFEHISPETPVMDMTPSVLLDRTNNTTLTVSPKRVRKGTAHEKKRVTNSKRTGKWTVAPVGVFPGSSDVITTQGDDQSSPRKGRSKTQSKIHTDLAYFEHIPKKWLSTPDAVELLATLDVSGDGPSPTSPFAAGIDQDSHKNGGEPPEMEICLSWRQELTPFGVHAVNQDNKNVDRQGANVGDRRTCSQTPRGVPRLGMASHWQREWADPVDPTGLQQQQQQQQQEEWQIDEFWRAQGREFSETEQSVVLTLANLRFVRHLQRTTKWALEKPSLGGNTRGPPTTAVSSVMQPYWAQSGSGWGSTNLARLDNTLVRNHVTRSHSDCVRVVSPFLPQAPLVPHMSSSPSPSPSFRSKGQESCTGTVCTIGQGDERGQTPRDQTPRDRQQQLDMDLDKPAFSSLDTREQHQHQPMHSHYQRIGDVPEWIDSSCPEEVLHMSQDHGYTGLQQSGQEYHQYNYRYHYQYQQQIAHHHHHLWRQSQGLHESSLGCCGYGQCIQSQQYQQHSSPLPHEEYSMNRIASSWSGTFPVPMWMS